MPDLSLDWYLFLLRLAFIVLLYLFLYQVVRVTFKDLLSRADQAGAPVVAAPGRRLASSARLSVVDPGSSGLPQGLDLLLGVTSAIGRHSGNDIALDDPSVSGQHAEIAWVRNRWWVSDLGSTNGTLVNGSRIDSSSPLEPGDLVQFGRVSGRFQA